MRLYGIKKLLHNKTNGLNGLLIEEAAHRMGENPC
jgi:hypothetical protein